MNSVLTFDGHNLFEGNAAEQGGSLYLLQGRVAFYGVTEFTHNSVSGNGGAIYAASAAVNLKEA